ncbi:MAG: purine-nucleoside phosphorylase [Lachnospiraceae bacterium]|jgi:purine-nucleoside phosphorylase|nr:purine-nucleoside phosphorylase [Lachnospiraceae bacterium]
MATPHNEARQGEIAPVVLMPGDPLRAEFIAKEYLEKAVCFNRVRGMLGYTGIYHGIPVSVMGHGMGIPSMGIYSYELYNLYDVQVIIRIGSAGGLSEKVRVKDIILGMGASTDSNYGRQYELPGSFAPLADYELLKMAAKAAEEQKLRFHVGNLLTSDVFYEERPEVSRRWSDMGVLAVEMETAALYMNAAKAGRRALAICTVSDHLLTGEALGSEERQTGFRQMMELGLQTGVCAAKNLL